MLDDTRGFNPNFTLRSGGGCHQPLPRVNPSRIFVAPFFLNWHLFDQTFFGKKNCLTKSIFTWNFLTNYFDKKNSFNKIFDQNLEEKIFVSKTFVDKKFVFTKSASECLAVSLTELLA